MNTKFLYELKPNCWFNMVIGSGETGPYFFFGIHRENHLAMCEDKDGQEFEISSHIPVVLVDKPEKEDGKAVDRS